MRRPRPAPLAASLALTLAAVTPLTGCPGGGTEQRGGEPAAAAVAGPPAPAAGAASGQATLVLMADLRGVLRPCGCTADLQKGGFDRLQPHLDKERKDHPGLAVLHAGPLFFEEPTDDPAELAQRERQSEVCAGLVARVGIDVVGGSSQDAVSGRGAYKRLAEQAKVTVTAANLSVGEAHGATVPAMQPFVVRKVGDLRVGIFALDAPHEAGATAGAPTVEDPAAAAERTVKALSGKADVIVLLSGLGLRDTKRLVRNVSGIHFAVAGGMGEHPSFAPEAELVGTTRVMQFHREGRYIGRLTVRLHDGAADFVDASAPSAAELEAMDQRIAAMEQAFEGWKKEQRDPKSREMRNAAHHLAALKDERERLGKLDATPPADRSSFSFILTPLNWDLPQDPEILALMDAFDAELKSITAKHAGTLPEPKPGEAVYVGVDACLTCHEGTQAFWDGTLHKVAWETLAKQNKTFDSKCISCHLTGYGKAGGSIVGKTEGREAVQCEACHGPGSLHIDAKDDAAFKSTIVREVPESTCTTCHNQHHSPSFKFGPYRERLLVPGHGKPLAP